MKKRVNIKYVIILLFFLLTALIYVSDVENLPENVVLFEGEPLNLRTIFGVDVKTSFSSNPSIERIENKKTVTASANAQDIDLTGNLNLDVAVFGIKVKEINVDIIESSELVPLGNLIGVKLYTNGVLVVGKSGITGADSNTYNPYEGANIEEGDIIVSVNGKEVSSTFELTNQINASKGSDLNIRYIRDDIELETSLKPVKTSDNVYKIGLWVRDTAAGVGTASFYDPSTKKFAGLGHRNC